MCGIFGYYNFKKKSFSKNDKLLEKLMIESFSRGREASGVAALSDGKLSYIKSDLNGRNLLKSEEYNIFKTKVRNEKITTAIGHSRLATHGSQLYRENNQPVISKNEQYVLIHNGIITNKDAIWKKINSTEVVPELDTAVLLELLADKLNERSTKNAFWETYSEIEGSASISLIDLNKEEVYLATNTGSLYFVTDIQNDIMFFASEMIFLKKIMKDMKMKTLDIFHLKPRSGLIVNSEGITQFSLAEQEPIERSEKTKYNNKNGVVFFDYSVDESRSDAKVLYSFVNDINKLKSHVIDINKINHMKRCVKCILPASTPFIHFDEQGVCSYCNDHKKITYKGLDQLKEEIKKFNLRKDGRPNCLAAFSGGRDSSYGLHFLKKELGLEPLAYTYDWGMVTDIARENQARILGKLGIEHIVVSADITQKRKHINQNIRAWMKDPHLGMVPLFMEGDKQCEFYADRLMKKYDLDLMFFFRGNELEKDEFKTGHCGVSDADPKGVIHNLALKNKVQLLSFYASRYIKNPAYFNSSFFDTSLGFFSTYIQKHSYLYLWHYIPWSEKTIVDTLQKEYNWQISSETPQTWRTDDGTSAFYNYIYYQVQGFTENDSFRSRQIREGILTREKALELITEENKPRYESLCWYFDMVGLNGDEVLSVVDNMKKLY